jgi:uncharacterized membrane protein
MCLVALVSCGGLCAASAWLAVVVRLHPFAVLGSCALLCLAGITACLVSPSRHWPAALLGATAALLVAGGVCGFAVWRLKLTGVFNTTMRDLWYGSMTAQLKLHWVVLGAMILTGVGAIADLAIAVTSTMGEVQAVNPRATRKELERAGLRLGRDVTGTEINTLIFALVGLSLGAALLPLAPPDVAQAPVPWLEVANRQAIAVEVVAALAGTLGMILAIPLTALVGGALMIRGRGHGQD